MEVLPGIILEAYLEDATGKFNLNSLVGGAGPNGDEEVDPIALQKLRKPDGTGRRRAQVGVADRGLDRSRYAALTRRRRRQSVRNAGSALSRAEHRSSRRRPRLLALPGFGRERYLKSGPFVTALPRDASINVCSARAWCSIRWSGPRMTRATGRSGAAAQDPAQNGCFPTHGRLSSSTFGKRGSPELAEGARDRVSEASNYFRLTSIVTIGSAEFTSVQSFTA